MNQLGLNERELKQLTYLQLCTVPSLIPSYLALWDLVDLRNILFLNCQTFLELHQAYQSNPHSQQFYGFLMECTQKPLGHQLMRFLVRICKYYLENKFLLEDLVLRRDFSADWHMSTLVKVVLKQLIAQSQLARINSDYIQTLICLQDLSTELSDLKNISSKGVKQPSEIQQTKIHEKRANKMEKTHKYLKVLSQKEDEVFSKIVREGFNLLKKYEFVMFEGKKQKEKKAPEKEGNGVLQVEEKQMVEEYLEEQLNLQSQLQQKEEEITNLYFHSLNSCLPTHKIEQIYNTISTSVHQIFIQNPSVSHQQDLQCISQAKSNFYCLLLSSKLLLGIQRKQQFQALFEQTQKTLKELLSYKFPKLQKMWLLMYTFIQGELQKEMVKKCIELFDWIIQLYSKNYRIQESQYVFAEYLIICKQLLVSLSSDSGNPIQVVKSWLQKPYLDRQFREMFSTLPMSILDRIAEHLLRSNFSRKIVYDLSKLDQESKELFQALLSNCGQKFQEKVDFLRKPKQQMMEEVDQKKDEKLDLFLDIWLQKNNETSLQKEFVLWTYLYQLFRNISSPINLKMKKILLTNLSKKGIKICSSLAIASINSLLMEYSVPGKKGIPIKVSQNIEIKEGSIVLGKLQFIIGFLSTFLFALDPQVNKQFMLHSIVISGHLEEQVLQSTMREIFFSSFIKQRREFGFVGFQKILKYSSKYDSLELFYELVISNQLQLQKERQYQKFCRQWCGSEENYQWLSELKSAKLKLIRFKSYCLDHFQNIS